MSDRMNNFQDIIKALATHGDCDGDYGSDDDDDGDVVDDGEVDDGDDDDK